MSMVAVNNVLNNRVMVSRLHANDFIKSCEVLLDERIPDVSNVVEPNQYAFEKKRLLRKNTENERVRYFNTPNTFLPSAQVYGNDRYSVCITNSGAGYSKFKDIYLTRFEEDLTLDTSGSHIYIKDADSKRVWSAAYQPLGVMPEKYEVRFYPDHAEFLRTDGDTFTALNVFVPAEKNFEVRELILTNKSSMPKTYEITTYSEVLLDAYLDGLTHPAFNKLFVESSFENNTLIAKRKRKNPDDAEKFAFHFAVSTDIDLEISGYETSREEFIGRTNTVKTPAALNVSLTNTVGTVLDPIFSIRTKVRVNPGSTSKVYFIYGYASTLNEITIVKDLLSVQGSVSELQASAKQYVQAKRTHLGIDTKHELLYQKVASRLLYPDYRFKERIRLEKQHGRKVLYRFGLSGENRMLVLKVNSKNSELI